MKVEIDPVIIVKYVEELLKENKPIKELKRICAEKLVEFLGHETDAFVSRLFQDLENGSANNHSDDGGSLKKFEQSPGFVAMDSLEFDSSSPKHERRSSSICQLSDLDENDFSDDEDDDRNHKHRRREAQSQCSDRDCPDQLPHRTGRKRGRLLDNGLPLESDPQSIEGGTPGYGRYSGQRFERRRQGFGSSSHLAQDGIMRTRAISAMHSDSGSRFDLSNSLGRPSIGKGRGRGFWNPADSRFVSNDSLDFSSSLARHGPAVPALFPSRGLPGMSTAHNPSWNAFGLIHGLPNGVLDPLHTLHNGLHMPIPTPMKPSLNIGMPRARCRDFEERGFCLRGDMCPMEHGVNRIVVEDVQSLSQFNLPVSVPSNRGLSMTATGSTSALPATSSILATNKELHKPDKYELNDDELASGELLATDNEADLYDPDKPLWNNDRRDTPGGLMRHSAPKNTDLGISWDDDPATGNDLRAADGNGTMKLARSLEVSDRDQEPSAWGRIGATSTSKNEVADKSNDLTAVTSMGIGNNDIGGRVNDVHSASHRGKSIGCNESKSINDIHPWKARPVPFHGNEEGSGRAVSTLFVNFIPPKDNKKDALLSHFKRFGDVIGIFIPPMSERAFVQFSRREDAEAALRAPDAVLGNRFIRLWWAKRDNVSFPREDNVHPSVNAVVSSAPVISTSQPLAADIQNARSSILKPSSSPNNASETPVSLNANSKSLAPTNHKPSPLQKLESLELLKEELRKKQELLEKKRNDFRQQLDKLEKQGIAGKSEVAAEKVTKGPKAEAVGETTRVVPLSVRSNSEVLKLEDRSAGKAETVPEATTVLPDTVIKGQKAETMRETTRVIPIQNLSNPESLKLEIKSLGSSDSNDNAPSPSPKLLTGTHQSLKSFKQLTRVPSQIGLPSPVNRFKLDNRSTSFKILPPLPANLTNVALLKEHFAAFGDVSLVELENSEGHTCDEGSIPVKDFSVRISFITRSAAERAFSSGKCLQGHTLQFAWLPAPSPMKDQTSVGIPENLKLKEPSLGTSSSKKLISGSESLSFNGNTSSESSTSIAASVSNSETCASEKDMEIGHVAEKPPDVMQQLDDGGVNSSHS